MHRIVPTFEFRRRARKAMKPVMPILLVVALIAALPSLISEAVTLIANANPGTLLTEYSNRILQVMETHGLVTASVVEETVIIDEALLMEDLLAALEDYAGYAAGFLQEKGPVMVTLGLMLLICSPVLTLGMINALLHALRGKPFGASAALSRLPYLFKALGLMFVFALKLLLYALPGTAAAIVGLLFLPVNIGLAVFFIGAIAAVVMDTMASYRYAMATFILADHPATSIRDCFRRSSEVMHGRRMELFALEISFIFWYLLLSMLESMLSSFGAVIAMTLSMFASLYLTVYTTCAQAAFYQEYAVGPLDSQPGETEAQSA